MDTPTWDYPVYVGHLNHCHLPLNAYLDCFSLLFLIFFKSLRRLIICLMICEFDSVGHFCLSSDLYSFRRNSYRLLIVLFAFLLGEFISFFFIIIVWFVFPLGELYHFWSSYNLYSLFGIYIIFYPHMICIPSGAIYIIFGRHIICIPSRWIYIIFGHHIICIPSREFISFLLVDWIFLVVYLTWLKHTRKMKRKTTIFCFLLMVPLEVFNIPWTRKWFPIHWFQLVAFSSWVISDLVRSFLRWSKFALC